MTTAVLLIRRLHQHRNWVNQHLLAAAADLDEEPLRRTFAIGQGSIWASLLHLYAAEYVWLETLQGNQSGLLPGDLPGKLPGNQQGTGGVTGMAELQRDWAALQVRWEEYLDSLTDKQLEQPVYRASSRVNSGQPIATSRSDVLLHVCTHAQYTTAQVVNMFRQCGVESLPPTMLIALARQEAAG
ncbi:DinB family protein [Lignipirellula cremea]|uniref:DinB family protein n=1 Tax=Lignipirellula cremea TaxID=2528010 RepID=A0A518DZB7_9BACT|nr:DinB family protein [Lignipirellula cremea]QDU97186.1 DinB family protein [Lignipirellula cremea]